MNSYEKLTWKMAFQLTAPRSWVASVTPALFGIMFCRLNNYYLTVQQMIFMLIGTVLMQCSVNALNDYIDFIKGNDSKEDNVEISDAVLVYNNINPKHVLNLGAFYLILGCLLGGIACIGKGFAPLSIGIVGALIVVLYSGGAFPISALPLGEVVSGFVMGSLIPLGIAAASDGKIHYEIFLYSSPFLLGIALIMMTNNSCDIEKDLKGKRYTLAVILGRDKMKKIYHSLIGIWLILLLILSFLQFGKLGYLMVILLLLAHKPFKFLLKTNLLPTERIMQMKTIVIANILGNGSYLLVMLAKIIMG